MLTYFEILPINPFVEYKNKHRECTFFSYRLDIKAVLACIFAFMMTSCLTSERTVNTSATAICSTDQASTGPCIVSSAGTYVTTTAGSDITAWENGSALTSVTAQIGNGYYLNKSVTFTSSSLLAENIRGGISIFGVTGTYSNLSSMAHHTLGSTQVTSYSEVSNFAGVRLPSSSPYVYREVPNINLDDDGTTGGNVSYVSRTSWTGKTCGTTGTLAERKADCLATLGSQSTWDGSVSGNAGQGLWNIVTRTGDCSISTPSSDRCREVWQDARTGLLWSSRVATATNWCKAAGNNQMDVSGYCNDALKQNQSGAAISACYDGGLTSNFTDTDAISNSIVNKLGKGGLSSTASLTSPAVIWRLPTIYDWQVANVNGIRYVMPDMGANNTGGSIQGEWSSTVKSTDRSKAWVFDFYLGGFSAVIRSESALIGARCVGH